MTASVVRAMLRSHPIKPPHSDATSRCIDACFNCVETCTACADACLSEPGIERLTTCIRLNLDCAELCAATGAVLSRANKAGNRQLLEALLTTCLAFCRACAAECQDHADMHRHCEVCAEACRTGVEACNAMLNALRMPA